MFISVWHDNIVWGGCNFIVQSQYNASLAICYRVFRVQRNCILYRTHSTNWQVCVIIDYLICYSHCQLNFRFKFHGLQLILVCFQNLIWKKKMTDIWTILILGVILLWLINVMMPSWQNFTVLLACFRQYMEELVTYVERNPRNKKCSKWKSDAILSSLPTFLREAIRPTAWRECYTKHDIQACLSRVQTVGYNEKRVKILVQHFSLQSVDLSDSLFI